MRGRTIYKQTGMEVRGGPMHDCMPTYVHVHIITEWNQSNGNMGHYQLVKIYVISSQELCVHPLWQCSRLCYHHLPPHHFRHLLHWACSCPYRFFPGWFSQVPSPGPEPSKVSPLCLFAWAEPVAGHVQACPPTQQSLPRVVLADLLAEKIAELLPWDWWNHFSSVRQLESGTYLYIYIYI